MAAPDPVARQDPSDNGIKLADGFPTKVALTSDPIIEFWEKTVQPPGIDGGDPIETSTMFNTTWRTMSPRQLKTLTDISIVAAYDPDVYDQIDARLNVETTITVTFPDSSTLAFFGYLRLFEPQDMEEGSQPEANITITPTNWDHINNVEAGFALVETAGT